MKSPKKIIFAVLNRLVAELSDYIHVIYTCVGLNKLFTEKNVFEKLCRKTLLYP